MRRSRDMPTKSSHAKQDHSMSISDNGRGMPVDVHKEKVSGLSSSLRGSTPVPNLTTINIAIRGSPRGRRIGRQRSIGTVRVFVRRDGNLHYMSFKDGEVKSPLAIKESVGKRNTGTLIAFKPNPKYFDSQRFSVSRLKHLLKPRLSSVQA